MKIVLLEIQRVLRARILSVAAVFAVVAALAFAVNELGVRFAGSAQISFDLFEIVGGATSSSAYDADICADCVSTDPDQVISAVNVYVGSREFWASVSDDYLNESGGEMPRFSILGSGAAIEGGEDDDGRPETRLVQDLRAVSDIGLSRAEGTLEITVYRVERDDAVRLLRAFDRTVREFVLGEVTRGYRRELQVAEIRADFGRQRGLAVAQVTDGVAGFAAYGGALAPRADGRIALLSEMLRDLERRSGALQALYHLDAVTRGAPLDPNLLGGATSGLLFDIRSAIEALPPEVDRSAEASRVVAAFGREITDLRQQLEADVSTLGDEVAGILDEVETRSAIGLAGLDVARQRIDILQDQVLLEQRVLALTQTLERVQTAVLRTSQFVNIRLWSGIRAAVLIGLLAAIAYVAWALSRDFGARKIVQGSDLRELSLQTLGEVPFQDGFTGPIASVGESRPQLVMARAMRNIRSAILASTGANEHLTVLVTSSVMSEGKSFLSRELAWAFSSLEGQRVLLVSGDYRRIVPMQGLSEQPKHTLATLMLGTSFDEEIDLYVPELGFEYLPARPIELDADDLLSSPRYDTVMEKLRKEFDVIIIDGPPILPVADSINLARCADLTIFAVRQDSTPVSSVIEGLTRLRMAGVKPISAVLTCTVRDDDDHDGYLSYIGASKK